VAKLLRYAGVSVVSTAVGLTVLGLLVGVADLPATWANVIATAVGTVPSFELNRRWVWGKAGTRSVVAEVVPFCALSFTGLALSTLAVHAAATWADAAGWTRLARTVAVELANVSAFGLLWLVQFVVLDRVLFAPAAPTQPAGCAATPGRALGRM
jgi:putative flippase GtrA